jgi:hypothetical protein
MNDMHPTFDSAPGPDRRAFLNRFGLGLGAIALSDLVHSTAAAESGGVLTALHHAPKAKRVIFLNIAESPVHIHDFQATLLHLLGIDHERLTYKYQGRRFRLTDVHGEVVEGILA